MPGIVPLGFGASGAADEAGDCPAPGSVHAEDGAELGAGDARVPDQREPAQTHDRDEDRRRKLTALRARLWEGAMALRTPVDWAECLRLAALMPGEEFANILLIAAQRPEATMVRDYRQWALMGRQVRRREKGIEIFAIPPRREQTRKVQNKMIRNEAGDMWTRSPTSGTCRRPQDRLWPPPSASRRSAQIRPGCWTRSAGLHAGRASPSNTGTARRPTAPPSAPRRIRLLPGVSEDQAAWALAHQLGHILLDHGANPRLRCATSTERSRRVGGDD